MSQLDLHFNKIAIATNNKKKIEEIRPLLENLGMTLLTPQDLKIDFNPEETGKTFAENAEIKSRALFLASSYPSLADDSGICVDSLGGAPGVYSARYGFPEFDDRDRAMHLLKEMQGKSDRHAKYICAITLTDGNGTKYFQGETEGRICLDYYDGGKGFGYDPIFYSTELEKRFSEVELSEKNSVSHRGRAIRQLIEYLEKSKKTS